MEKQDKHNNICPAEMDSLKKIGLTKKEKRTIFLNLLKKRLKPRFVVDLSQVEILEEKTPPYL